MNQKFYNRFFHLHTVSGITISFALFIIFYAGTLTFFREPMEQWEQGATAGKELPSSFRLDIDRAVHSLRKRSDLTTKTISFHEPDNGYIPIEIRDANPSAEPVNQHFRMDPVTYDLKATKAGESPTIAGLLYELHFYYQLERPGYYLAGLVSFFFLFALITGLIVHWNKIKLNFFVFRPGAKLKTVWTDAHTILGLIGFPFQLLYALTGAMFGLGIVLAIAGSSLYNNDVNALYEDLFPYYRAETAADTSGTAAAYNPFLDSVHSNLGSFHLHEITIYNTGASNETIHIHGETDPSKQFHSEADFVYSTQTDSLVYSSNPFDRPYERKVWSSVYRLHFAEFGAMGTAWHYLIKTLYFLLGILSSFVILTGVLVWVEARSKKGTEEKRLRFTKRTGRIFLSVCLTLIPATFLSLLASILLPPDDPNRSVSLNALFFGSWLILTIGYALPFLARRLFVHVLMTVTVLVPILLVTRGVLHRHLPFQFSSNTAVAVFEVVLFFFGSTAAYTWFKLRRKEQKGE